MKQLKIIIRPEKLGDVKRALDSINCPGMMVWEIEGHGKQKGLTEQFRGRQFKIDFLPKTRIEVVLNDIDVAKAIDVVVKAAGTGAVGDGKIFVSAIDEVVRIRTGERGAVAVG